MTENSSSTWIGIREKIKSPFIVVFANNFEVEQPLEVELTYSADERCSIYLGGELLESGPDHGCVDLWFSRRIKILLTAGSHCLAARVYCYREPKITAYAQVSIQSGFFLESEKLPRLNTGNPAWRYKILSGCAFAAPVLSWGTGTKTTIDGSSYPWDILTGGGGGWEPAETIEDTRPLTPSSLPPQKYIPVNKIRVRFVSKIPGPNETRMILENNDVEEEHQLWQDLFDGQAISLPAGYCRQIIIDLNDYFCVYPELVFSGGINARFEIAFAESLFDDEEYQEFPNLSSKGNRDQIFNKYFHGDNDSFSSDGGEHRTFSSFWWSSGRYMRINIKNPDEELRIESFVNYETGYPLVQHFSIKSSSDKFDKMLKKCFRTLEACTHDLYIDCPYYEQLMYIGDTKIQSLITYVCTSDSRMPERALEMLLRSQNEDGMISSYFPSWNTQIIPFFPLIYFTMLYDYAMWRGNPEFLSRLLPDVRKLLEYFLSCRDQVGLINVPGWNFIDWIEEGGWSNGVPPDSDKGPNAVINWMLVQALEKIAEIEKYAGCPGLAEKYLKTADELAGIVIDKFYVKEKGVFASDLNHRHFSEHAQIIALTSDRVPVRIADKLLAILNGHNTLIKPNIFFTHFFFELCVKYKMSEKFYQRLGRWLEFDEYGLKTMPEQLKSPRSDCHAWSAHPLYHFFASICGIRPAKFGFRRVFISPNPGPLSELRCRLPHPDGEIIVNMSFLNSGFQGDITLPCGVSGELVWLDNRFDLESHGKKQVFKILSESKMTS